MGVVRRPMKSYVDFPYNPYSGDGIETTILLWGEVWINSKIEALGGSQLVNG